MSVTNSSKNTSYFKARNASSNSSGSITRDEVKRSATIITNLIQQGVIVKPKPESIDFFMIRGEEALKVAERLLVLEKQEALPSSLWVVNSAYYSMFFSATALLAHHGHRIRSEQSIHSLTYHALLHYFLHEQSKLKRCMLEEYRISASEAESLLQTLIVDIGRESRKRKVFTYEMEQSAEQKHATTSFERAKRFYTEVKRLIS